MQQRVHPQQPGARERDTFRIQLGQKAVRLERVQLCAEAIERIDPVLLVESTGPDRAALQLEDELANEALVRVRPIGTAERQVAGFNRRRVFSQVSTF